MTAMTTNRQAFLDMLAISEGTSNHPLTKNNGYDVIVTGPEGPEIFRDYSDHPFANRSPKQVRGDLYSTASGRYQFMKRDWNHYRKALNLPDFGPDSQDQWALQLIRERSALPLIDGGDFAMAVARCKNIWASLPGAGYGQPEHSLEKLMLAYKDAGGIVA